MASDPGSLPEAAGTILGLMAGSHVARPVRTVDAYVFKSVIHMHDDDNSVAILSNCRRAMPADGKVILIERLLPGRIDPSDSRTQANLLLDMSMMLFNGGCERTEREYAQLLAKADLRLTDALATAGPQSIIEAAPA